MTDSGTSGTSIAGNFIGTNAAGTGAVPNANDGVLVRAGTSGTTIGAGNGTFATLNFISGNAANGIEVDAAGTGIYFTTVGADVTDQKAIGNGGDGLLVNGVVGTNLQLDLIANNAGYGILTTNGATNNSFRDSDIFNNALGGILEQGNPSLQPAPVLTSATSVNGQTTITGSIFGSPSKSTQLSLDFFASPYSTSAASIQGKTYIGEANVTTDTNGNVNFTVTISATVPAGQIVTATSSLGLSATSQFSNAATVPTTSSSSATFLKKDTTTQGNWIGTYGTQGYDVIGDTPSLSPYATVTPSGELTHVWSASSTAPQALQNPGGSGRIEECWYSATSFTVNLNLIDGQAHDIELYFLDLQSSPSRVEQIQISDAKTGTVLDTETVSSFTGGAYLDWKVQGDVVITITHEAGANAVLSGLFVDPAATTSSSSATFLKKDTTTQGNWIGTYGKQGYDVIGDTPSLSPYATVTPSGELTHVWSASSTAPQALQNPGGSGRIEECWYSATSFTVNLNLIDGQAHDIELYFLDLQSSPSRVEQIQISDAKTGTVLDTETVSSFTGGAYLDWKVQGDVVITITHEAGANAVLSGLFVDPASSSATVVKTDTTTQGSWIGTYDTQSYDVIDDTPSLSSYPTVSPSGNSTYVWAASTTDARAGRTPPATAGSPRPGTPPPLLSFNLDFTDGKAHEVSLYVVDFDNHNRSVPNKP